jgi:hypothetical protein
MWARPLLLPALLLAGCIKVPGTEEGGPCNKQGICLEGLICDHESNTCVSPEQISWQKMTTPAPTTLRSVWGFHENDLFAVGDSGTVFRYQGSGLDWSADAGAKTEAGTHALHRVWGRGSELWVVGNGVVLHYAGTWSRQTVMDYSQATPKPYSDFNLYAVGGGPTGTVWAVGQAASNEHVFRLQGSEWRVDDGVTLDFSGTDLIGIGPQVFVVGHAQNVRIFAGGKWTTKNLDQLLALKGVWGAAADDVWAVGPEKTLVHYDGQGWTTQNVPDLPAVHGITGTQAGDFYLVSSSSSYYSSRADVYHCTPSCYPTPTTTEKVSRTFYAAWSSPDGSTVVVVGEEGSIYRRQKQQ